MKVAGSNPAGGIDVSEHQDAVQAKHVKKQVRVLITEPVQGWQTLLCTQYRFPNRPGSAGYNKWPAGRQSLSMSFNGL